MCIIYWIFWKKK